MYEFIRYGLNSAASLSTAAYAERTGRPTHRPHTLTIRRVLMAAMLLALLPASSYAQLPSGWTASNIGNPWLKGSAQYSSGTYTISGSGSDIAGSRDQFMFVYQQLQGDGVITARVSSLDRPNDAAKAGVMFRASLTQSSQHALMFVSAAQGTGFQRRISDSGTNRLTAGSTASAPRWIRLERRGSTFSAYESADGATWSLVGTETMSAPATMYVGLAVTSHNTSALANATFRSVSVSTPALPSGWSAGDVGAPAVKGQTTYSAGAFSVTGGGADVWGTADQFQFAYTQIDGDVDIVTRVASVQNTNVWTKAGAMIRASLDAGSAHGSMFVSASRGAAFQRRRTTGATSLSTAGSTAPAPMWVKLSRRGSTITASQSTDGSRWTTVGSDTITLPSRVYVGLAVTSHDASAAAKSVLDSVTVTPVSATQNQAPTVSLTAPANGTHYTAPGTLTLTAAASDSDGRVTRVDFYSNGTIVGSSTASPYSVPWSSVPAGTYTLTAVATDDDAATTTSSPVTIVVDGAGQPPTVSLTAPANGSTYQAPATVTVTASASDADGSIAKVEFYAGTALIGSDASSPFSVAWSNVPAGSYSLTAVAYDNVGAKTTSTARSITVGSNQPPAVALTSPAAGANYLSPTTVGLSANASDANGIASVAFYNGSTLLGTDNTSPYAFTWQNVPAGTYSITALATDTIGGKTTSAAVSITVASSRTAVFTASPDHASVASYLLEVFAAGANPATAAPVASQNLGKPALVNGDCSADITSTLRGLAPGSYFATVSAIEADGSKSRSAPSPNFLR